MSQRLKQAFPSIKNQDFPGVKFVIFGDSRQLPPVKGEAVYNINKRSNKIDQEGHRIFMENFVHSL